MNCKVSSRDFTERLVHHIYGSLIVCPKKQYCGLLFAVVAFCPYLTVCDSSSQTKFVTKKNRTAVYSYIFKEGVLVAKKDFFAPSHDEIEDVPNLEVLMLMKSMKSRDFVRETFNWQYYYYYLLPSGIEHLREYLRLPEDIIPEVGGWLDEVELELGWAVTIGHNPHVHNDDIIVVVCYISEYLIYLLS